MFSKGKLKKGGKEVCSEMDDAIFFFVCLEVLVVVCMNL